MGEAGCGNEREELNNKSVTYVPGSFVTHVPVHTKEWYGDEQGEEVKYAEAFELCEYGKQPSEAGLKKLFPFFGK